MPAHLSLYLDALRVLAAVVVFMGHFAQGWLGGGLFWQAQPFGHTAVIVFFVISGYVIAFTAATKESSLRAFAVARLCRVLSVAVPALLVSAIMLIAVAAIDPAHYAELQKRGGAHTEASTITQFVAGLLFLGESWGLHIRVLGNTPYWSLVYEVWYYIIFGCIVFLRGRQRIIAAGAACLIAGPKILLMAPIWAAGVAVWHWRHRIPAHGALALAFASALLFGYLASESVRQHSPGFSGPWWPMEFRATDHLLGLVFALHIAAVGAIRTTSTQLPGHVSRLIKTVAAYTFSIYLFHYPLLVFFAAVLPGQSADPGRRAALLMITALAIYALAQVSEKKYAALKAFSQRRL